MLRATTVLATLLVPAARRVRRSASARGLATTSYELLDRNPFDVHVYFGSVEEREAALRLQDDMRKEFPWMRFYAPKDRCVGPHPASMWEADFADASNAHHWPHASHVRAEPETIICSNRTIGP